MYIYIWFFLIIICKKKSQFHYMPIFFSYTILFFYMPYTQLHFIKKVNEDFFNFVKFK